MRAYWQGARDHIFRMCAVLHVSVRASLDLHLLLCGGYAGRCSQSLQWLAAAPDAVMRADAGAPAFLAVDPPVVDDDDMCVGCLLQTDDTSPALLRNP